MENVYDKLERWSSAAAQELQELLDDAVDCGSELTCIQELLNEHNEIMNELHGNWQELQADTGSDQIDFGETH